MKKFFVVFTALVLCAGFALAATAKQTKATVKEVPVTVIVMDDDATGGADANLNSGLEQVLGVKLNITKVNRSEALKDPKYQGLNLDFMPLYLVENNTLVQEKFDRYIKAGQIKEHNGYLVFEHQTRNGV